MNYRHIALVAAALAAVACGRGPELIDRTQPNYIKKSDLLSGTWYIQDTVVDVPATGAILPIGYGGMMDKVRFEIQENTLVAFRTYEWIPGTDPLVDREKSTIGSTVLIDGRPFRGAPVSAWPIESHFDRQRQYNPATGEQTNVLEENGTDRPWYEREFIRVNWANNISGNFLDGSDDDFVKAASLRSYVTSIDQNQGDSAFFTEYKTVGGKKTLTYFDFTTRAYLNPPKFYYPGYGSLPYCWLNPRIDCESQEMKLRTSVLKVDEAHVQDYEPLLYGDKLMKKFGFFRSERVSYDRNRGVTETGRLTYANRHNLWKKSHEVAGTCNSASACPEGFACEFGACRRPLPVQERELEPVVYYLTPNFPQELLPAAKQTEESWDFAFRRAVAVPRGIEVADVPQMFHVCQTPVPKGAPAACGPEGLSVRLGDLRYNLIPWIDQPQIYGPLGLGPSAPDPETGEIVQGVANIYGAALDTWAGDAQSIVDLLNGDLTIDELIAGKNVKEYVFEHLNATDPRRPPSGPWSSQQGLTSEPQVPLASYARIRGNLKAQVDAMVKTGHPPLALQNRRKVVAELISKSPALESEILNQPEVRSMVLSMAPGGEFGRRLQTDATLYRQVARETILRTGEMEKLRQDRVVKASTLPHNGCAYLAEFLDEGMVGFAKKMKVFYDKRFAELKAQGKTDEDARRIARDEVWNEIRIAAFRAVTEHEIGHTVGLTHNFVGSFDAMNFVDGYWDLRKQTIGVLVGGQRVLPSSPQNLLDASKPNQAQMDAQMHEYQYSTVMDYASRINSDVRGIGKYDDAAILFAYAGGGEPGWVEVFNQTRQDYDSPNISVPTENLAKPMVVRGAQVELPLAQVEHYTPVSNFYTDRFHYTTLPFHFADRSTLDKGFEAALDEGIKRMHNRSFRKWSEMEAVYGKIENEVHQWNLRFGGWSAPDWEKARDIVGKVARNAPVEVPYMYCSDYEVGANIACNRWDAGADVFEMTQDWISRYKEYYAFNSFRRDRLACYDDSCFGPSTYLQRIEGRYLGNLPNVYQQWLFNIYWLQNWYQISTEQMEEWFGVGDPIFQNYWTMAVIDSTNFLVQQLSTPSAGYHGKLPSGTWVHLPGNNPYNGRFTAAREATFITDMKAQGYTDVVYVPRGPGKTMYTLYDDEGMDYFGRVNEIGHFWDQVVALFALTSSETNFLGVDRGADALRYSLPYYMTFNRELADTFSSVWIDDRPRYAAGLLKTGNGLATVVPPNFVRGEDYIANFNYPPRTPTPVDTTGNPLPLEKVEASPTWSTRFYSEVWGMAYFTENFNQEFASYNQVFRLGSGEQLTPAAGYEVEQFADPFGGYIYAALKQTGATKVTAAPQLIINARNYKTKWDQATTPSEKALWEAKTREAVRSLEIMRGLYNIFGTAW
ncbi:MAG: zinc-dependent metalloprotease [Myxococcales bacterium]|nr:zinc-dependent metalloprotease [Myxococcales bacterium]